MDILDVFNEQLSSETLPKPFLLTLLPLKLGTGLDRRKDANWVCYLGVVESIFAPSVSQVELRLLVTSIRNVINFHRKHFHNNSKEAQDLFTATNIFLRYLYTSLSYFDRSTDPGWSDLFEMCVLLVQLIFDYHHQDVDTSVEDESYSYPPRVLSDLIIENLKAITSIVPSCSEQSTSPVGPQDFQLSSETKKYLLEIEPGSDVKKYSHFEKRQLLDAFRSIDPSLPLWDPTESLKLLPGMKSLVQFNRSMARASGSHF
ncbi:hypothetical protein H0H87_012991 [Tephrocybe sp. NHM501043]|nr:hypothetical protein H0H87_012991 [Tephrocybe sp. NHM501043]